MGDSSFLASWFKRRAMMMGMFVYCLEILLLFKTSFSKVDSGNSPPHCERTDENDVKSNKTNEI